MKRHEPHGLETHFEGPFARVVLIEHVHADRYGPPRYQCQGIMFEMYDGCMPI